MASRVLALLCMVEGQHHHTAPVDDVPSGQKPGHVLQDAYPKRRIKEVRNPIQTINKKNSIKCLVTRRHAFPLRDSHVNPGMAHLPLRGDVKPCRLQAVTYLRDRR